ncbi:hypothetical protein D3C81_1203250 [compost metagenome]
MVFRRKTVVGAFQYPVSDRPGLAAGVHVAEYRRVGHDVVMLGFHHQHIAFEVGAGAQRPVGIGGHHLAPVGHQILVVVQLPLGRLPSAIHVERRGAQGQPTHRAQFAEYGGKVAAVTAAHHGDGIAVYLGVPHQHVIGSQHIGQVAHAADGFVLRGGTGVTGQVESHADAAQTGHLARARQVLLLAAAPPVHEQHAGELGGRRDQRAGDGAAIGMDL